MRGRMNNGNENALNFVNHGNDTTVLQGSPHHCYLHLNLYEHFVGVLNSFPTARRIKAKDHGTP